MYKKTKYILEPIFVQCISVVMNIFAIKELCNHNVKIHPNEFCKYVLNALIIFYSFCKNKKYNLLKYAYKYIMT